MSQQNVALTRQVIDAFNRRDLGAYLSLMDPGVELTPYEVWVQGGDPYLGHAGVRSWWEDTFAVLPDLEAEVYEVRDLGDRTFVHGCISGQGAASGAPIERTMAGRGMAQPGGRVVVRLRERGRGPRSRGAAGVDHRALLPCAKKRALEPALRR